MTTPARSKSAKLAAVFLFPMLVALPVVHATEWIISPTGSTALPTGGSTTQGSNLIKDGDIITLYMNPTTGGPINTAALNNALINFQNTPNPGFVPPSFTIRSGDGNWYTITNRKTATGANTGAISSFSGPGNSTITLINIIFADNYTTNGNGAAIMFAAGSALVSDTVTVTGTAIFRGNGGTASGMLGGAIHNAMGNFVLSGSFIFEYNFAGRGGAINTAATAGNDYIKGDILFFSNTSQSQGGAFNFQQFQSATAFFDGNIRFLENKANAGGAFSSNIDQNNNPSAAWVVFSGTTLFQGNTATTNGGAILQGGQGLVIGGNTTFEGNTAGGLGGAIYQFNNKSGLQINPENSFQLNGEPTTTLVGAFVALDATTGDILFRNNTHKTSTAGEHNAIVLYSGTYTNGGTTTLTLNAAVGRNIYFYDPIAVSDTTDYGAQQTYVNVTQTGAGAVVYDTYQSVITHTTTIQSGTMILNNGAIYGASSTHGYFNLQNTAVLAAATGNGTLQAATIALDDTAQINIAPGSTLQLLATTLTGTNLNVSGNGTLQLRAPVTQTLNLSAAGAIDAAQPLTASLVNVAGSNNTAPQTLTLAAGTPLTITDGGTLAFNLFTGGAGDLLAVTDALTLTGTAYINLLGAATGSYKIITASNNLSALAPSLTTLVGGVEPSGHFSATPDFTHGINELWIDFSTQNVITKWTGAGATWADSPAGGNSNWIANGAPADLIFINGDSVIFDNTATGTRTITVASAGVIAADITVANSAGNDYTFAGAGAIATSTTNSTGPTPTGKLVKTDTGALNFTNGSATTGNTFAAGIEISGGTIGFTRGNQLGDGGNGIHFTAAAGGAGGAGGATLRSNATTTLANTLKLDPAVTATIDTAGNTLTHTGLLNGSGTLAKTGAGTLRLTADNSTTTINTTIRQGTLAIDGALGAAITTSSNATLAGSGTATGSVTAGPGAIIAPGAAGSSTPTTLTINTLALDAATLRFNLFSTGANDRLNVTTLTLGAASTIDISTFQTGTYNLGSGISTLAGVQVTIGGFAQAAGARQVATATAAPGATDLLLITAADISRILTWTGSSGASWNPNDSNWTAPGSVTLYADGDKVIFNDTATQRAITIAGSGIKVSDMIVDTTSNYTFSGAGITADPASVISGTVITTGTGKLIKQGSGTLALANAANNFLGGIEINAGAITYTDAAQLGEGGNGIQFTGNAKLASATPGAATLATAITLNAGVTGTLDTGAGALTLTAALASPSAATLAKTGAGTLTLAADSADAAPLTLALKEGALLVDNITYAGTIDAAAGTLLTAAGAIGSASMAGSSTLQIANNTLHIDNLRLAANSVLTGEGALTGATTLEGAVTAAINSGALTLDGAITGAGGFVKTGAGTLELSGTAALGNTGITQIDQGALHIAGISGFTGTEAGAINIASTITQNIVLNGGTLALAGSGALAEATASDWSRLALAQGPSAATSAITGVNEIIRIRDTGSFAPALRDGLIVAIDPGAAATTILSSTANNFTGLVRIDSGILQVTTTTGLGALGTGNTNKVVLNGGALRISSSLTTTRSIELRQGNGAIIVDDGITTQWGLINRPAAATAATFTGTLTKAGSGTLTLTGANQSTAMNIEGGRFRITSGNTSLPQNNGPVDVSRGATFELAATGTAVSGALGAVAGQPYTILNSTGTITTPFTGSGTLEITSNKYAFTSPRVTISNIIITGTNTSLAILNNQSVVDFSPAGSITVEKGASLVLASVGHNLGNITLADGATLAFLMNGTMVASSTNPTTGEVTPARFTTNAAGFKTATLATLSSTGTGNTLYFNTNLALGRSDHLAITAETRGTFALGINNWGDLPEKYYSSMELLSLPANNTATFTPATPAIDIGLYSYTVGAATNADGTVSVSITGTGAMSNSATLINATASVLPLTWFAELNSVTQRMGELHLDPRAGQSGPAAWMRVNGRQIDYNHKAVGAPFREYQYSAETGIDYKFGGTPHNIYIGAFAGYARSRRDHEAAGESQNESTYIGLYQTLSTKRGWYADGVLKANSFTNRLRADSPTLESARARYHNWAVGGSLEIGKYCDIGYGWFVKPQIQGAYSYISNKDYVTDTGIAVELRETTTAHGRVGFQFGRIIETESGGIAHIYVKGYGASQWTTDGRIYVVTPTGQNRRYAPTIKGDSLEGGFGVSYQMKASTQFYLDYETSQSDYYIKPWGINFGLRLFW